MKILAIETSCDETAVALIETRGDISNLQFKVLAHNLYSQASKHAEFGGVYPSLAKREHAKNLIPLLKETLVEANFLQVKSEKLKVESKKIQKKLERNPELLEQFLEFVPTVEKPDIDLIAVTKGPGLEPALWVGITFAEALGEMWNIPVRGVDHMEGHIASVLYRSNVEIPNSKFQIPKFPSLALLISGGHTQLVLIEKWGEYKILGETRDDAVGEAYDKTARLLGLPYPGGPEISRLAEKAKESGRQSSVEFPRPMINSDDYDFSFSGLKTAVLYYIQKKDSLSEEEKEDIALEVENAILDVLISKTSQAIKEFSPKTLILAGGVTASHRVRNDFKKLVDNNFPDVSPHIPAGELSTDNAIMIGIAAGLHANEKLPELKAEGNLKINQV